MKDILILGQKIMMNEQMESAFKKWLTNHNLLYGPLNAVTYGTAITAFEAGWKAYDDFSSAEGINFILKHVMPHDSTKTNK